MVESREGTGTSLNTAMTETVSVMPKSPQPTAPVSPSPHFNSTAVTPRNHNPGPQKGNWFNSAEAADIGIDSRLE